MENFPLHWKSGLSDVWHRKWCTCMDENNPVKDLHISVYATKSPDMFAQPAILGEGRKLPNAWIIQAEISGRGAPAAFAT